MSNYQYLDKAGATYIISKIKTLLTNKVDKDGSKVLSDVNFTTTLKNKLDGIEAGAQVNNVLDSEKAIWNAKQNALEFNTAYNASTNKVATMTDLKNHVSDADKSKWNGKQDALSFNTAYNASTNKVATMQDVNSAVSSISGLSFSVVTKLPTTGTNGVIYLLSNGGSGQNLYDEYIWLSSSNSFEKIGSTSVDLSDYIKSSELVEISNIEIDAMFS